MYFNRTTYLSALGTIIFFDNSFSIIISIFFFVKLCVFSVILCAIALHHRWAAMPQSYAKNTQSCTKILLIGISIFLQVIMSIFKNNIEDEKKTVKVMITMYCNSHHDSSRGNMCNSCSSLLDYALSRIDNCVFGMDKPTCEKCPVHCYEKEQRDEIKKIMRYAGPRMLFRHPILTIKHLLNNRRHIKQKGSGTNP